MLLQFGFLSSSVDYYASSDGIIDLFHDLGVCLYICEVRKRRGYLNHFDPLLSDQSFPRRIGRKLLLQGKKYVEGQ